MTGRRIFAALTLLTGCVLPATAHAWSRTKTIKSGKALYWEESCLWITPSLRPSDDLNPSEIANAVWASAVSWSRGAVACTYMDIRVDQPSAAGKVAADGTNTLVFYEDFWCPERDPADKKYCANRDPMNCDYCNQSGALALTPVFFRDDPTRDDDGRIFDADLEVNGVHFQWANLDEEGVIDGRYVDLQNTLAHEFGHVIGLAHNCHQQGGEAPGVGPDGQPSPDCGSVSAVLQQSTMYIKAFSGELSKRTLEADDVEGLCAAYPIERDPGLCDRTELPGTKKGGCGATFAPGAVRDPLALAGLGLVSALALARRRRRP